MKTLIVIIYFVYGQGFFIHSKPQTKYEYQAAIAIVEPCNCPNKILQNEEYKTNPNALIPINDTVWINNFNGCGKIIEYANE